MYEKVGIEAKHRWDAIAKPIDSLGLLEEYVVKLCSIYETVAVPDIKKRAVLVFCSDHGVVAEGVTQTDSSITKIVADNFAADRSCVNHMARRADVNVYTIDIGMDCDNYPNKDLNVGRVIDRKIGRGTKNLAKEPAMTMDECKKAIARGGILLNELKDLGYSIVALGEMGIGNTTPTSALASIYLDLPIAQVTGKGAGLSEEGIKHKAFVIEQAISRLNKEQLADPYKVLSQVGGYEIAAMVGVCLAAVDARIPVVLDGVVSSVAALVASQINPEVTKYVLASHVTAERSGALALEKMGLSAIIHGNLCLGEGTGAMTLFPLLDMAIEVYARMSTFEDNDIVPYTRFDQE